MENKLLKAYSPPTINMDALGMEQGIMATSQANLTPGGTAPFTPDVEDWTIENKSEDFYL